MKPILHYRLAEKPTPRQKIVAVAIGFFATLVLLGIGG
jgi:hypothetical protein